MKRQKVLDSYALLVYLKGEKGCEIVRDLLRSADAPMLMNDINIGEVFYILLRERGEKEAEYFIRAILPSLPVAAVANALSDVLDAARIKGEYAISFADCFAAATAIRQDASLVTGDPDFRKLEGKVDVVWL